MKKINRVLFAALLIALSVAFAACSALFSHEDLPVESVQALSFKKTSLTVSVGASEHLPITVKPANLQSAAPIEWEYDEAHIAINPDSYGVVITGVMEGSSYIKAAVNGITATCMITIEAVEGEFVAEPYIYSQVSVAELAPGNSQTLSVSLYGGQSYDLEDFSWSVVDPSLASIAYSRNNCVVTASRPGSTQLVATHPKAAYPYTFILFVYADELIESYLSTANNVITINKSDSQTRSVSVEIQNPNGLVLQSGFAWEVIAAEGGEPCVSVVANGDTAILTPLSKGIAILRASYEDCAYPLDMLVRVTAAVRNVYIVPSTTTLIATGSDVSYAVHADIVGHNGYANPDAFVWTVPEDASYYMDWEAVGNTFSLTGKINGSVKITVSHELSEYSRSVLIALREQAGSAIDASLYITTSSNYVQTKAGADTTQIAVALMGGEPGDEQNLVWKIDNGINNDICAIETPNGRVAARAAGRHTNGALYITPRNIGTATVSVSHPKILNETEIIIKVYSAYARLEEPAYLVSDVSLVRMLNGTTREVTATLSGNTAIGDENGVVWRSADPEVIALAPETGTTTVASALGTGSRQTYLTASHPKAASDKRILALSADTQAALDAMKGFYADETYFRLNENGTARLALSQFGLEEADIQKIVWTADKPGICIVAADSANRLNATITGIAPGTAAIAASLAGCEPCRFQVTVLPEGEPIGTVLPQYLTTGKNAIVLSEPGASSPLQVTGVNISAAALNTQTVWRVEDPAVVSLSAVGPSATVAALKAGKTKIAVSNPESSNTLSIDVKVGALYEWDDAAVAYITTEQDTIAMTRGETKTIAAALANSASQAGFAFRVSGSPIIAAKGSASGTCLIEALEAGVSELTVSNAAAATDKTILVVVANSPEELRGFPYLTTKQNVATIGESFNATVTVTVANAEQPVLQGYRWTSSDPTIVTVVDSGQVAVLYGQKAGTAKITVTNDACLYPLEIIANCVNPVLAANNPYIMSPNIVTLTVDDPAVTITADLVGGKPSDYAAFAWRISDGLTVSCLASNETAQLRALKAGVVQLIISHPKANGIDRSVLVICEPKPVADCYISAAESIIRMSPSDSAKTITATLVGGTASDAYNFRWWADSYDLIEMNYTANAAIIKPLASGSVTIHISHPKAAYQKDIIINISQYTEFAFETKSRTLIAGTQSFVNMQVPASQVATRVSYAARTASGGDASAILSVSGTNLVCVLDPHAEGTAIVTASLVTVNAGAVQATCELLVSVSRAEANATYISYSGGTIITIEKGVTKTLRAALTGHNAVAGDSKALQWQSGDPSIVKVAPASLSGVAVNDEIQITALKAGSECTITVSHEKANQNLILYCIVPGENAASIALDRTLVNLIEGDNPHSLAAAITNAEEDDYANLEWTIAQQQSVVAVEISGSGKKISVLPRAAGSAVITAKVPSSGKTAACAISVEAPKTIALSRATLSTYPGETVAVQYAVSPPEETGSVVWTASDNAYVQVSDDRQGTITIYGKYKEGIAAITGTTASKASAQLTVKNGWGNAFVLEKSLIKSIPVNAHDGTFDVRYELKPACAELRIWGLSNMALAAGTYDSFANGIYTMNPSRHSPADPETGVVSGVIRFNPSGESKTAVVVQAWNPVAASTVDGSIVPAEVASRRIQMNVYYNSYIFIPQNFMRNGKYSRYDTETGSFIVGDGEQMSFTLVSVEQNGTPQIDEVRFERNGSEPTGSDGIKQNSLVAASAASGGGSFIIEHIRDYGAASGAFYALPNAGDWAVEQYNTAVRAVPLAGMVTVRYRLFGADGIQEYRFPLYVEIRNCLKSF
jgi:uncharacterized protein YjdB